MEGNQNQNTNPLDYSQSGVVYKDLNGNGTAPSNIKSNEFVDQNGIKSPSAASGQVKYTHTHIFVYACFPFFRCFRLCFPLNPFEMKKSNFRRTRILCE